MIDVVDDRWTAPGRLPVVDPGDRQATSRADHGAPEDGAPGPGHRSRPGSTLASVLTSLAVVTMTMVLSVSVLGGLEEHATQRLAFSRLRNALALGTAPLGQLDAKGRLLRPGTPVALLEIPRLHLRDVVREGTTSQILMGGPGHLRNTVLPGQAGASVVFGRATTYGGPFGSIAGLHKGDVITVITGIGTSTFTVIDQRHAGDPMPPAVAAGSGRLTLVTASGSPFLASGVHYVDADLHGPAQATAALSLTSVPHGELALGISTGSLWALVLLLQVLLGVVLAGAWSWTRWGRLQTWIVFAPLTILLATMVADQAARLLPNLL